MPATQGAISQFDAKVEDFASYIERLNYYFIANDVTTDQKKKSILLTVCGPTTFKLIRNLADAHQLEAKPYEEIVKMVKDHCDPKPSCIVQHFKFNTRSRGADESIAAYVTALREIAKHCQYKDLPEMLRDRLVCGVNHEGIRQRLLSEKDLKYDRALEIAQSMESAEQGSSDIKSGLAADTSTSTSTNLVSGLRALYPARILQELIVFILLSSCVQSV